MEIDWSKAPKEATHYDTAIGMFCNVNGFWQPVEGYQPWSSPRPVVASSEAVDQFRPRPKLKPRDLACFQQVADVLGEANAADELGWVIDADDVHAMSSGLGIREDRVAAAFLWDETPQGHDFWRRIEMGVRVDDSEYTGGSVSYYAVRVLNPTNPTADSYDAECNDIIEALRMNYAEGNAFKALWRRAAARMGKHKRGYDGGLYDAEKVEFFGARLVEQSKQESGND